MSRLDVLTEWLARSEWRVWEAASLLVGFCPERSQISDDQANDWYRLPGKSIHKASSFDDAKWRDADIEAEIARKRGRLINLLPGGSEAAETPRRILELARKGSFLPPWLPTAQDDPVCNKLLPPELRERKRSVAEANRDRVAGKLANDPQQRLLNEEARRIFDRLAAGSFQGVRKRKSGLPYKVALAKAILDELQETNPKYAPEDTRSIVNRITVWLGAMERNQPDGETE